MNLDETRKAKLAILTMLYYSRPRTDSLPRFIRRLKPRDMRYQSLLRGAFKTKREEAIKDVFTARGKVCANSRRRKRQGRMYPEKQLANDSRILAFKAGRRFGKTVRL